MSITTTIARHALALALVLALAAAAALPAAARTQKLGHYGSWTSYGDGATVMIVDRFEDRTLVAVSMSDGRLVLLIKDERWRLRPKDEYRATVVIDGRLFDLRATYLDRTTLAVQELGPEFFAAFMQGEGAELAIENQRWTLTLTGAAKAFNDGLRYLSRTRYEPAR